METKPLSLHMRLRLQAEGTTGPEMAVMVTSGDLLKLLDERPPLSGLDFTPDAQHSVADMANVGYALLQEIQAYRPGYVWSATPAEIVGDLCEQLSNFSDAPAGTANATLERGIGGRAQQKMLV